MRGRLTRERERDTDVYLHGQSTFGILTPLLLQFVLTHSNVSGTSRRQVVDQLHLSPVYLLFICFVLIIANMLLYDTINGDVRQRQSVILWPSAGYQSMLLDHGYDLGLLCYCDFCPYRIILRGVLRRWFMRCVGTLTRSLDL